MKSRVAKYLNEIVSIAVMSLMAIALIASQVSAGADGDKAARRAEYVVVISPTKD